MNKTQAMWVAIMLYSVAQTVRHPEDVLAFFVSLVAGAALIWVSPIRRTP